MKEIMITGLLCLLFSLANCQKERATDIIQLFSRGELKIDGLHTNSNNIGKYEKFEVTFGLSGMWDNPFDPEQVRVDAHFYSPDGAQFVVPGFFFQDYFLDQNGDLQVAGTPVWKVRFTPRSDGEYRFEVIVTNRGKQIKSQMQSFKCTDYNASHGFVQISKTNPLYFEYSDGNPFLAIAMGKAGASPSTYETLYKKFATAGGNFNRLFLTGGSINIEEVNPTPQRSDRGLGKMNLESSWNLDRILELGEKMGVYHVLTLTNQWTFHNRWVVHAFNKKNGGILESPSDYWTNEEALKYFEKRLRYHVARWGYSTSVFSWDLWNEYTAAPGAEIAVAIKWHQRMARYLASVDPFDHIIHTNDGSLNGREEMNGLPEMEIISTNSYAMKNIAEVAETWTRHMIERYNKPFILTEFGPGHTTAGVGGYGAMDPERRMVHNGMWSPIMSGSAGTGVPWEGSWLEHPLYYTYVGAIARFTDGIPFSQRQWKPVQILAFTSKGRNQNKDAYSDVIVEGWPGNFRKAEEVPEFHQIDASGKVANGEALNAVLSGTHGSRSRSSVTFKVSFPTNGDFVVYVTELRGTEPTPKLTVMLDGKQELEKELLPLNSPNYHPLGYNQYYVINISAGSHLIKVENTGGGSFVTAFELRNYIANAGPELEVRGIQTDDHILLWLKNQKFTILHELMKIGLQQQQEGVLQLADVPEGKWVAEWMNTVTDQFIRREVVESRNQTLMLNTPLVDKSVAVRLKKL